MRWKFWQPFRLHPYSSPYPYSYSYYRSYPQLSPPTTPLPFAFIRACPAACCALLRGPFAVSPPRSLTTPCRLEGFFHRVEPGFHRVEALFHSMELFLHSMELFFQPPAATTAVSGVLGPRSDHGVDRHAWAFLACRHISPLEGRLLRASQTTRWRLPRHLRSSRRSSSRFADSASKGYLRKMMEPENTRYAVGAWDVRTLTSPDSGSTAGVMLRPTPRRGTTGILRRGCRPPPPIMCGADGRPRRRQRCREACRDGDRF